MSRWSVSKPGVGSGLTVMALLSLLAGCQYVPNHYAEDGPSVAMSWDTPSSKDYKAYAEPLETKSRGWAQQTAHMVDGRVVHLPLYFEDPFEDKGDGRTNETNPRDVYRLGWEDWVAFPYGISRFTLNGLLFPVSFVTQPPWPYMVSDGELSKQLLGYDHDATRIGQDGLPEPAPIGFSHGDAGADLPVKSAPADEEPAPSEREELSAV